MFSLRARVECYRRISISFSLYKLIKAGFWLCAASDSSSSKSVFQKLTCPSTFNWGLHKGLIKDPFSLGSGSQSCLEPDQVLPDTPDTQGLELGSLLNKWREGPQLFFFFFLSFERSDRQGHTAWKKQLRWRRTRPSPFVRTNHRKRFGSHGRGRSRRLRRCVRSHCERCLFFIILFLNVSRSGIQKAGGTKLMNNNHKKKKKKECMLLGKNVKQIIELCRCGNLLSIW